VACTRLSLRQLGRKKYPLVRNLPRFELISNTGFEIESLIVDIVNSDSVTVFFDSPFSSMPSVIANLVTVTSLPPTPPPPVPSIDLGPSTTIMSITPTSSSVFELGNVNVYVESIDLDRAVIRTSAPITGKIHVHAMKIQGC